MTQQLVLEPLGIITEPNKLGQIPAGAFSVMTNCVERSPGIIENMRAWQTIATVPHTTSSTSACFVIATPGPYMLVLWNYRSTGFGDWGWAWLNQTTGATVYEGDLYTDVGFQNHQSFDLTRQPRFSYTIIGQQVFVNCFSEVIVWDTYQPTTAAAAAPRSGGLHSLSLSGTTAVSAGDGTACGVGRWVAYTAIVKRTLGDKTLVSAPSAATYFSTLTTGGANCSVRAKLVSGLHIAGDTVELYRTKSKPAGYSGTFLSYQQGEEVGAEYQRATTITVQAADVTAGYIDLLDKTGDEALGEALYTNQSLESVGAAAMPPPAANVLVGYKGFLFGFGTTLPPVIQLRPTGFWGGFDGAMTTGQINSGLGQLIVSGCTYTTGSSTITVTPGSQTATIPVGAIPVGTGFSGVQQVNSVTVPGSFTVSPNPASNGTSLPISFTDLLDVEGTNAFISNWKVCYSGITSLTNMAIFAPALKLPPFSLSLSSFVAQPTDGFVLGHRVLDDARTPLRVRCTRGFNFDPQIGTFVSNYTYVYPQYKPNQMAWSEQNQPDAWPFTNVDSFSIGTVCTAVSTRDAIIPFYTDGIWAVTGTGGAAGAGYDWRADPLLKGITICGSQDVCVLLDRVYARTSEGLIAIDGTQITKVTQGRIHDQLDTPPWSDGPGIGAGASFLVADEENSEIIMRAPSATGEMWIYNVNTDRLSQTTSHTRPVHGDYSRFLRAPLIVGNDGSTTWTVRAPIGAYGNCSMTYQPVYADNPFAQRHWQTLNVSGESSAATITPTFNGVACSARSLGTDGRVAFEVPRNAPAIGNSMQVKIDVTTSVRTKLNGFALDYRDHTDRRRTR